jgi:hypothetical protein
MALTIVLRDPKGGYFLATNSCTVGNLINRPSLNPATSPLFKVGEVLFIIHGSSLLMEQLRSDFDFGAVHAPLSEHSLYRDFVMPYVDFLESKAIIKRAEDHTYNLDNNFSAIIADKDHVYSYSDGEISPVQSCLIDGQQVSSCYGIFDAYLDKGIYSEKDLILLVMKAANRTVAGVIYPLLFTHTGSSECTIIEEDGSETTRPIRQVAPSLQKPKKKATPKKAQ